MPMTTKLLRRSKTDRIIGGVAAGIGAYAGIGPLLIRLGWVLFTLLGGAGVLMYLIAWAIIPDEHGRRSILPLLLLACAILIPGDLGEPDFAEKLVRKVVDTFGRLDILVNNAGEQHPDKDIRGISDKQLRRTFQTNIFSMFYLVQAAQQHLKKGAAIVNCTSVTMYKGSKELLDYSATKGAITAFTRSLSANLVKDGIRVNAVAPGPIWTPLNPSGGKPPEEIPDFGKDTPMGRPGEPNEVAPAFLFLACEDASYMTGQVLHPNGGEIVNG